MDEFEIIDRYFLRGSYPTGVVVGISDDGAVIENPAGEETVLATDTLVESVHFPVGTNALDLGHKSLAVNLSDLAAMGAVPRWALLNLVLPQADDDWISQFSLGFMSLADEYDVVLIGGDTCRGPLCITVTVVGTLPAGTAITRGGARPGDQIWISGSLGDASIGLGIVQAGVDPADPDEVWLMRRLNAPQPRVTLGCSLRGLASAAIDLSDGLLADLGHILHYSGGLGAVLEVSLLPVSPAALAVCGQRAARSSALAGGDDYELCFTVPRRHEAEIEALEKQQDHQITKIGEVCADEGIQLTGSDSKHYNVTGAGHLHNWPDGG
jgi:thiamine-monophosphate kinase